MSSRWNSFKGFHLRFLKSHQTLSLIPDHRKSSSSGLPPSFCASAPRSFSAIHGSTHQSVSEIPLMDVCPFSNHTNRPILALSFLPFPGLCSIRVGTYLSHRESLLQCCPLLFHPVYLLLQFREKGSRTGAGKPDGKMMLVGCAMCSSPARTTCSRAQ